MSQGSGPTFTLITPPVGGTGTVSATIASLASGQSAGFLLTVNVNWASLSGRSQQSASAASTEPDADPSNNSSTATTTVAGADLAITKTDSPSLVVGAGNNLTYTLTVSNAGPLNASSVALSIPSRPTRRSSP